MFHTVTLPKTHSQNRWSLSMGVMMKKFQVFEKKEKDEREEKKISNFSFIFILYYFPSSKLNC